MEWSGEIEGIKLKTEVETNPLKYAETFFLFSVYTLGFPM